MAETFSPLLLLLHGVTGGWDELILLVAGVALAVFVVKRTQRSAANQAEAEDVVDPPTEIECPPVETR